MTKPKPEPEKYVFLQLPTCPRCNALHDLLRTTRTTNHADGAKVQRKKCLQCDWRFQVVWDPSPTIGVND